jgi:Flp pilus assembly protein TadD
MRQMTDDVPTFSHAEALYRAGDVSAAARLLAVLPLSQPALLLRGLCHLKQGDTAAALNLLQQAYALDPADPQAQLNFGIALQAAGRHAEAANLFRACRAGLPGDPAPLVNLASSLLALGDPQQALRAASDACHVAPDRAETHYTYGLAWQAAGQPDRAMEAFSAALRRAPRFADAWVNFGVACYLRGDMDSAKAAMRTALQVAPLHRAAAANLGAFLRLTGEAEGAETLLRQLLAREPDAAEARLNLAAEFLSEERAAEALLLLDEARLPSEPRIRRHWLLQRALALLQLNRPSEAREVLSAIGEVPPEVLPLLLWRQVLLAQAEGDPVLARNLAARMEAAVDSAGPNAVPEHRIMASYDLAKFWSQQGQHSRAFGHWARGHAQLARFQPFSRAAHRAFVDTSIAAFGRERLRHGSRASNRDPAPVFVVGMPRSGTTLMEQILAAHAQVHGAGERGALGNAFFRLGGGGAETEKLCRIAALDPRDLDAAAVAYLEDLHALAPQADRIVDKMPGNFLYLGLVALLLPGARIIHCCRDPRDIGLSIFTFRFHGHHGYAHDLGDLGWYIGEHDRLNAHWRAALPNPILQVKLSDWVANFDATLARVLAFLELPDDPACKTFYQSQNRVRTVSRAQIRQPVNARGLGRWRTYENHLAPLIAELNAAGSLEGWT